MQRCCGVNCQEYSPEQNTFLCQKSFFPGVTLHIFLLKLTKKKKLKLFRTRFVEWRTMPRCNQEVHEETKWKIALLLTSLNRPPWHSRNSIPKDLISQLFCERRKSKPGTRLSAVWLYNCANSGLCDVIYHPTAVNYAARKTKILNIFPQKGRQTQFWGGKSACVVLLARISFLLATSFIKVCAFISKPKSSFGTK